MPNPNAQVINFSNNDVKVAGILDGGPMRVWTLKPNQQTIKGRFAVEGVRGDKPLLAIFSPRVKIFNSYDWWVFNQDIELKVFVHHLFTKQRLVLLSLHCIPYEDSAVPTSALTYRPGTDAEQEQLDDLDDGDSGFDEPANPPKKETDVDMYRGLLWDPALGLGGPLALGWVRSRDDVLVRIKLVPDADVVHRLDYLKSEWRRLIKATWKPGKDGSFTWSIRWDVQWVADEMSPHHEVNVHRAMSARWNSKNWYDEVKKGTVEHEFGHLIGLNDEYLREGEVPYIASRIGYSPPANNSWPTIVQGPAKPVGAKDSPHTRRAKIRWDNKSLCEKTYTPSIMSCGRSFLITKPLIEAFESHSHQELCYTDELFGNAVDAYLPKAWSPPTFWQTITLCKNR